MKIATIYQIKIYVYENEYPEEASLPYEAVLLTTSNLHFANMVYRLYSKMYDNGDYCPYLAQYEEGQWKIDSVYLEAYNVI